MTCESCANDISTYGADPARIQWKIVRGDYSSLRFEFLEDDEITPLDMTGWTSVASAYYPVTNDSETLSTVHGLGYIDVSITSSQSVSWGNTFSSVVAELDFDLQITKPGNIIWTPVVGTICVLGDVTGGSL